MIHSKKTIDEQYKQREEKTIFKLKWEREGLDLPEDSSDNFSQQLRNFVLRLEPNEEISDIS
eukprot:snap_masked-scaffold_2-processed-gene-13.25-mRNA-1 protein AED:1.00 eAED:1.00 QI:0/0/0/0/1/1/2/0/61